MAADKVRLPVVMFEESDGDSSTRSRSPQGSGAREPIIKKMLFDVDGVHGIKGHGIRKYDNKPEHPPQDWCVLFDKIKHGETIIVAMPMDELEQKFIELEIIKVLS